MRGVRWGILGTGRVAGLFAAGLRSVEGARLQAVASRSKEGAAAFAARFGARRSHVGCEALVRDPEVDVVYVASVTELHREHCLVALDAGKAVVCEKPLALDAGQAREIADAARRRGVFCMEGMWMRLSPVVREAVSLARSGALGELRLVSAQLGFRGEPETARRLFTAPGGGALLDLAVYPLALAQALIGRPEGVTSVATPSATGVDEQVTALLRYPGGRQAVIASSIRVQLDNCATLHGTEAVLRIDAPLYFPESYELVATPRPSAPSGGRREGPLDRLRAHPWYRSAAALRTQLRRRSVTRRLPGTGYSVEATEVGRCLRAGLRECPDLPLDDSVAVLETADAIRRAWSAP